MEGKVYVTVAGLPHYLAPLVTFDNFKKGFVLINGFNLGRYWEIGPQKTLYVPRSILNEGENEIIVFESDGLKGEPIVEFGVEHILGASN